MGSGTLDQTSLHAPAQTAPAAGADHPSPSAPGASGAYGAPQVAVPPADRPAEEALPSVEHLIFTCRGVRCVVPLGALREVVRAVPPCVALPFSPPWLLGIFAQRTELLGLVDPAPLLLGEGALASAPTATPPAATLIAGADDQLLGLAVESLGEIVVIRPDEIVSDEIVSDEIVAAEGERAGEASVASAYLRGYYQPPAAEGAAACAVVDLEPFVATLLAVLREEAADV